MSDIPTTPPYREVRALFDDRTIRVYQAYNESIAMPAAETNRFAGIAGFKLRRSTWIKPSFCWMAYRSGYSLKDKNQARILAIDLKRPAFEAMLAKAVVNVNGEAARTSRSDVVVQWDPERHIALEKLAYRSIQIGLQGDVALEFARGDPIEKIEDVTSVFLQVKALLDQGSRLQAEQLLPVERPYPLPTELQAHLQMQE